MVMKRIPQSLFLALFVFAISGFAQIQPQQTAPVEVWKEFSSTAGRFKVSALLGDPTNTSSTIKSPLGKIKRHTFTFWVGFANFLVSYSDLPVILSEPDQVKEFLDHQWDKDEVVSQGKLLNRTEIELDGYPGRELIVETPKSTFRMKYYLVGRRFYQITVSTLTAGFLAADIRKRANELEKQGKKDLAKTVRENANNAAELARSMVLIADEFVSSFKLTGEPENKAPTVDEKGERVVVKRGVLGGAIKNKVEPAYPAEARAAGVSGKVEVQVTISEEGQVIEAIAISGPELLREAAVQAAKQWVFKPTRLDGAPVKVQGILTFNFTLE
jgi:TonB family protein